MSSVNVIGLGELQTKLNGLSADILEEIDVELNEAAVLWSELAINAAPTDTGRLKQHISVNPAGTLTYEVVSPIFYSPYQEWGTGDNVSVPEELAAYAIQFKGRKHIKGNRPHRFFFIQRPQVEAFLFDHINKILNTEH